MGMKISEEMSAAVRIRELEPKPNSANHPHTDELQQELGYSDGDGGEIYI